jgi:hypothetical protein
MRHDHDEESPEKASTERNACSSFVLIAAPLRFGRH